MILSILATVAVLAAIAVIAAALVLAETVLVYIALGLAGVSVLLLLGTLVQHRVSEDRPDRTDGLGKSSVPVTAVPDGHVVPEHLGRVPAPDPEPVREASLPERPAWSPPDDSGPEEPEYDVPRWQTPTAQDRLAPDTAVPDPAPSEEPSRAEASTEPPSEGDGPEDASFVFDPAAFAPVDGGGSHEEREDTPMAESSPDRVDESGKAPEAADAHPAEAQAAEDEATEGDTGPQDPEAAGEPAVEEESSTVETTSDQDASDPSLTGDGAAEDGGDVPSAGDLDAAGSVDSVEHDGGRADEDAVSDEPERAATSGEPSDQERPGEPEHSGESSGQEHSGEPEEPASVEDEPAAESSTETAGGTGGVPEAEETALGAVDLHDVGDPEPADRDAPVAEEDDGADPADERRDAVDVTSGVSPAEGAGPDGER